MKQTYIIIGGGISGLSLMHFLKKSLHPSSGVTVKLLEKQDVTGGTIRSFDEDGMLFEQGPNGFLGQEPKVFDLLADLGLEERLIHSRSDAKKRFIKHKDTLYEVPTSPKGLMRFSLLSWREKLRIFGELFVAPRAGAEESVHDFFARRFGLGIADKIVDPVLTGIYAGDIQRLHMRSLLPSLVDSERDAGSVLRGFIQARKEKKTPDSRRKQMYSFKNGMGELIKGLTDRYRADIVTGEEVSHLRRADDVWHVETHRQRYTASKIFLCAPAYTTAEMIGADLPEVAQLLQQIPYAPVAVVGLKCRLSDFVKRPEGFGYLIPSMERNVVLGVLNESLVFEGRTDSADTLTLRVMLGGMHHMNLASRTPDQLIELAVHEIRQTYGFNGSPLASRIRIWPKAIPQYTMTYPIIRKRLREELLSIPNLYLCANYIDGVSMNRCIRNAFELSRTAVEKPSYTRSL